MKKGNNSVTTPTRRVMAAVSLLTIIKMVTTVTIVATVTSVIAVATEVVLTAVATICSYGFSNGSR